MYSSERISATVLCIWKILTLLIDTSPYGSQTYFHGIKAVHPSGVAPFHLKNLLCAVGYNPEGLSKHCVVGAGAEVIRRSGATADPATLSTLRKAVLSISDISRCSVRQSNAAQDRFEAAVCLAFPSAPRSSRLRLCLASGIIRTSPPSCCCGLRLQASSPRTRWS
jgi:hypothetical protein